MKLKAIFRLATWLAAILVVSVGVAALAFIPFAKEPSYRFVTAWGSMGVEAGQFNDPTGLAISGSELFVSDSRNGRIQVFDPGGKFIRSFGKNGDKRGELGRPMNLAIFGTEIFVPEYFNDRIQVFDLAGKSKLSSARVVQARVSSMLPAVWPLTPRETFMWRIFTITASCNSKAMAPSSASGGRPVNRASGPGSLATPQMWRLGLTTGCLWPMAIMTAYRCLIQTAFFYPNGAGHWV